MSDLDTALAVIRTAILSIKSSGADGFEGLVQGVLTRISGCPFRLAKSGSQGGIDGAATYPLDHISFECKRYKESPPKGAIAAKLAEVGADDSVDLWVVAVTAPLGAQDVKLIERVSAKDGYTAVILDWLDGGLGALPVALAACAEYVCDFLAQNADGIDISDLKNALQVISATDEYSHHSERIKEQLTDPSLGGQAATKANQSWIRNAVETQMSSKAELGQVIEDSLSGKSTLHRREALETEIQNWIDDHESRYCALIGEEGHGKTWLSVSAWLHHSNPPLLLFLNSAKLKSVTDKQSAKELIVQEMLRQTNLASNEVGEKRWRRRLDRWLKAKATHPASILVVIDGVNQRPDISWSTVMDVLGDFVSDIGAKILITGRPGHYKLQIKPKTFVDFHQIAVPAWDDEERDEILKKNDIAPTGLRQGTLETLKNPRLLRLAMELLKENTSLSAQELTPEVLLLEHIAQGEKYGFHDVAGQQLSSILRNSAEALLKQKQRAPIVEEFESDLSCIAEGQFYGTVPGSESGVILQANATALAAALLVVEQLCRSAGSTPDTLDEDWRALCASIENMDIFGKTITTALYIASANDETPTSVLAALVVSFAELLNIPDGDYLGLKRLSDNRIVCLAEAIEKLDTLIAYPQNLDLVEYALLSGTDTQEKLAEIEPYIRRWLTLYSVEHHGKKSGNISVSRAKQIESESEALSARVDALTPSEKETLVNAVVCDSKDIWRTSDLALRLLAGKALAPFADDLVVNSLICSLERSPYRSENDLTDLIWNNNVDWPDCKEALLRKVAALNVQACSTTGKWAAIRIWGAIGTVSEMEVLISVRTPLVEDWPQLPSSRANQKFCAVDPCDPSVTVPQNFDETEVAFSALDEEKLFMTMGSTTESIIFDQALCAMARFSPEKAVEVIGRVLDGVIERSGPSLRQGILAYSRFAPLLTKAQADAAIELRGEVYNNPALNLSERDYWFLSTTLMLAAFPHLGQSEKHQVLLELPSADDVSEDVVDLVQSWQDDDFRARLEAAISEDKKHDLIILLAEAYWHAIPLSKESIDVIWHQWPSGDAAVHKMVLACLSRSSDDNILREFAGTNWSYKSEEDGWTAKVGSIVLVHAAESGILPWANAVLRIDPSMYGYAANVADERGLLIIAACYCDLLHKALNIEMPTTPQRFIHDLGETSDPHRIRYFVDVTEENQSDREHVRALIQSDDKFYERRDKITDDWNNFAANVGRAGASALLNNISLRDFRTMFEAAAELLVECARKVLDKPGSINGLNRNVVFKIANALFNGNANIAADLYCLAMGQDNSLSFSINGIPISALAVWDAVTNEETKRLRFQRLDQAIDDYQISVEVLAALQLGHSDQICSYVKERFASKRPADQCRALTVAGFADQRPEYEEILSQPAPSIGRKCAALLAANFAYERNIWAQHWYKKMCAADMQQQYWRYFVLFSKVVDHRYVVWHGNYEEHNTYAKDYAHHLRNAISDRDRKWKSKREKTLSGAKKPSSIFIPHLMGFVG